MRAPLLASAADGFHSSGTRRGPRIERCSFEGLDDDAIAIHGSYAMAIENRGRSLVVWRMREETNVLYGQAGDHLRFYNPQGALAGEAVMTAVRQLADYQPTAERRPAKSFLPFQNPVGAVFLEIDFDREVPAGKDWLVSNGACAGPGYVVRDCVIRNSFARGILPKGDGGLIEGNLIENTARAAIELNPELFQWSENDYSHDVVIRNNRIRNVNLNRQTGDLRHVGAITAFAFRDGTYVPAPGGHRNLLIANNAIEEVDGPNLLVTSAIGVRIENNRFIRPMRTVTNIGHDKGIDPQALIWLEATSQVSLEANSVEDPGPGFARFFACAPNTEPPRELTPTPRR